MTAANTLQELDRTIAGIMGEIETLTNHHASVAGDAKKAETAFTALTEAKARLAAAEARREPLTALVEQEASDAALAAAEADAEVANAMRSEMLAKIDRIAQIARDLDAAVGNLDQHAALKWFVAARKARDGGADVDRGSIEGVGELSEMLARAARRVQHVAADYSARSVQAR